MLHQKMGAFISMLSISMLLSWSLSMPINLLLTLKVLLSNFGKSLVSENMARNASKINDSAQLQGL